MRSSLDKTVDTDKQGQGKKPETDACCVIEDCGISQVWEEPFVPCGRKVGWQERKGRNYVEGAKDPEFERARAEFFEQILAKGMALGFGKELGYEQDNGEHGHCLGKEAGTVVEQVE